MNSRLLSIKLTGRSAAAAIYFECDLHYTEVRQLASDIDQAKVSLIGFITSLLEHFRIDSAVSDRTSTETRATTLATTVLDLLRERAIPHWSVAKADLFTAFGEVPLKSVAQLRGVVWNYWPHVIGQHDDPVCLDAAALGLYLQTERLLSDHSSSTP